MDETLSKQCDPSDRLVAAGTTTGFDGLVQVFAPLSTWTSYGTFGTVEKCQKELDRLSAIRSGVPLLEKAFTHSGCVADNDPRLKEGGEEPFLEK